MALHTKMAVRWVALVLALSLFSVFTAAQTGATYRARLTTGVAKLGEELALLIIVENGSASVESIPSVPGLEIGALGSPSMRESIQITGARRVATRSLTWRVSIRALEIGEYEIPGIGLLLDSQRVTTAPLRLTVVEDLRGEELGFLEVSVSNDQLVEKMPFELELLFGWDIGLAGKVDLANLILPWWGRMSELLELENPPGLMSQPIAINLNSTDEITVEELPNSIRNGRKYRTFRLRRAFLPTRPADLDLAQPFLEFGRSGQRGIFGTTRKKETYFVAGPPIELSIGALPTEGQPLDYTGAVGSFVVRADVDTRDVDVGESIKVTVTWTGDGNLLFFDPPQLDRDDAFEDFRVFGSANREKELHRRRIEFDMAPLDDKIRMIPSIGLSVYDPREGNFVTISTEPIPIRVRPLEGAVMLEDGEGEGGLGHDILDIDSTAGNQTADSEGLSGPELPTLGFIAAGLVVGWLALRTELRRRRGDPNAPAELRRRRARKCLARELARAESAADELRALQRFLAARTREPEVAWIGRNPVQHFKETDDSGSTLVLDLGDSGEELATAIEELERSAYAARTNGNGAPGGNELLQLADRLIRGGL